MHQDLSIFKGHVFTQICIEFVKSEITFVRADGKIYKMGSRPYDFVRLDDVIGYDDITSLCGVPIIDVEYNTDTDYKLFDSTTWSTFKFCTSKNEVTFIWRGRGAGFGSEEVTIEEVKK